MYNVGAWSRGQWWGIEDVAHSLHEIEVRDAMHCTECYIAVALVVNKMVATRIVDKVAVFTLGWCHCQWQGYHHCHVLSQLWCYCWTCHCLDPTT